MAILNFSHFRNWMNLAEIFLDYPSCQGFFPNFFDGGKHEGSKRNLNFQGITGITFNTFKVKIFFTVHNYIQARSQSLPCYRAVAAAEDLVLGFSFFCCHKFYKPLLNGCVMTY